MISHLKNANLLKIGNSHKNFQSLLRNIMVKSNKTNIMLTSLLVSAGMIITSLACGGIAYGAEAPAGDENFNYNGYSATQLKKISECISGVVPESECPSYESSSKDYYSETDGTVNHANMPTGVISTKAGWLKWADTAMKANNYDGVYGTLRIAPGGATGTTSSPTDVRFRLIGINQDNRADGSGKSGLTFQAINHYNIKSMMIVEFYPNVIGWRDSMLRNDLNDESTGAIWNTIQSTDFKNNITPVLKTTNNNANSKSSTNANASSITVDKLWILSPSEMGMPVIKNYKTIYGPRYGHGENQSDANVHYYDSDTYMNTIKSSNDGDNNYSDTDNPRYWYTEYHYLYASDTYQWWMLPAGTQISYGKQAYHNTDLYSYCSLIHNKPSANKTCYWDNDTYWLRSSYGYQPSAFSIGLGYEHASFPERVVLAFSF